METCRVAARLSVAVGGDGDQSLSRMSSLAHAVRAEKEPLLDIHPIDADPRGFTDGHTVRVFTGRGWLILHTRVSGRVRPGVVSMPSGWWASSSPSGRSANALTADRYRPR